MRTGRCPIEVGDYFYRQNHCTRTGSCIPDRLEAVEITEKDGSFFIRGRYIYHTIGPKFERVFSDIIFADPNWVIEKKGAKSA